MALLKEKLYFAYGSNLWREQMALRCPNSKFLGIARLPKYRWMINERGYANIAPSEEDDNEDGVPKEQDHKSNVWGSVYSLIPEDEARLDINEGVPYAYEKETKECEFWAAATSHRPENVLMLVYIDNQRNTGVHEPRKEYIHRMNMGIKDALEAGFPKRYVEEVLRKWIPEEEEEDSVDDREGGDKIKARELALQQARAFKDESGVIPETPKSGDDS
ncbi:hypothetical protein V8F20_004659 [Naviculisporaceae sp. PSN 640]